MHKALLTLILVVCIFRETAAQRVTDFYKQQPHKESGIGYRAGINYSFSTVTAYQDKQGIVGILGGVTPKIGYYLGAFYFKDLSPDRLTFRLDGTFQMKGVGSEYNGKPVMRAKYYYLGLTPLIGLHLAPKLTLYTGAEANWQVARQNTWGQGYPLELGTTVRLAYTIGQFRAEVSYFRGLTKFDTLDEILVFGPAIHDFYNQNLQVGLIYNWAH